MHKRCFKFFSIFLLFVTIITPETSLYAESSATRISESQLNMFAQNNINFWDPYGSECDTSTTNFTTKPSGDQITWIGDSYSVGAESIIKSKLSGVDYGNSSNNSSSYIQVSKFVSGSNSDNPPGLTILKNLIDQNKLRPYLVFALGTNGGWTNSSMSEFLNLINTTDTKAVLVTSKIPNNDYAASNQILKNAASNNPKIYLADWTQVYKSDFFNNDPEKIHPTANGGYDAWFNVIYNALPGGSAGTVAGNNNKEKIWNWFVNANIPGLSDNPSVIAGILGNLQVESNFNPFALNSSNGRKGLYQSNASSDMVTNINSSVGNYWGQTNVPQDANDKAIQIELEFLLSEYNWNANNADTNFINNLDLPTNKTGIQGARAYSDLWLATVEKAINGTSPLEDPGVSNKFPKLYQGAEERRDNAAAIYNELAGASATTLSASATPSSSSTSTSITWSDGWISGLPGITKQDGRDFSNDTPAATFSTPNGKPNKILLHNTEGTSNGKNAYSAGAAYPAHFTIDLKKKVGYQHFSINQPSAALAGGGDAAGPIQIEIVGFSTAKDSDNAYYLPNFSAEEWNYLATLLIAISQETGIPLTTSVNWENPIRMELEDFKNYSGILGHMHAGFGNTHTDPGNIWPQVEAAINRNPSASQFTTSSTGICQASNYGGNIALTDGGMTLEQAEQLMNEYWSLPDTSNLLSGASVSACDESGTGTSYKGNCVNFSKFFVKYKTTLTPTSWNLGDGRDFANGLARNTNIPTGKTPKVYSIFSKTGGSYGHTGVVLGIDQANNKILIGEAGCTGGWSIGTLYKLSSGGVRARVAWLPLSNYTSGYTYAYTDGYQKF